MRILLCLVAFAAASLFAGASAAQPIVVRDPAAYAGALRETMSVSGVTPLRSLYTELLRGGALPVNIEASLLAYERGLPSQQAVVSRVTDDVSLSDTFRSIYLYHYYGDNFWVHTRLDFVRVSQDGEWALGFAGFSSEWSGVALATTPGFRSSVRP